MAENKVEVDRDLLETLLADRREQKTKQRRWDLLKLRCKKAASAAVSHWGTLAFVGGVVATVASGGFLSPYGYGLVCNIAGQAAMAVGAVALAREAVTDALDRSAQKDQERLLLSDRTSEDPRPEAPEILEDEEAD